MASCMCVVRQCKESWNNLAQSNHLTVSIEILSHHVCGDGKINDVSRSMYDSPLKDGRSFVARCCMPQVCVDPINNGIPQINYIYIL